MRHRVVKGAACALLALSSAFAGCGNGEKSSSPPSAAPRGATVAVPELPVTLDPARASTLSERAITAATQTPLLTYRRTAGDEAATLEPALAGDLPTLSPDDREYRFQLRSGLVYADGRLVKASDVERAIAHASVASTDAGVRTVLGSIVGAPSKDGQTLPGVRSDDRTGVVVVQLRRPDGRVPFALADPATAPMPELPAKGKVPASTGPLRVASSTKRSVELAANPLRPTISTVPASKLAQVSIVAEPVGGWAVREDDLTAGRIDVDTTAPWPTDGKVPEGVARVTGPTMEVLAAYVAQSGPTASRAVRRALALAVDERGLAFPGPGYARSTGLTSVCGLIPAFVVGAVERDPCPAAPVVPVTKPLAGQRIRVVVGVAASATARVTKAIEALGGTPVVLLTPRNPIDALQAGRADVAITITGANRIPHPSFWLSDAANFDALLAREVPRETRGPLTGSGGRWSALERRAIDRAVAIPLGALERVVTVGPQIDRRTVLIHPVLGLDLAALDLS